MFIEGKVLLNCSAALLYAGQLGAIAWMTFALVVDIRATVLENIAIEVPGKIASMEENTVVFYYVSPEGAVHEATQSLWFFAKPPFIPGEAVAVALTNTELGTATIKGFRNFDCGALGLLFLIAWYVFGQLSSWLEFRTRIGLR